MATADDNFDVIAPKQIIIPVVSGVSANQPKVKGSLFISGAKLFFYNGSANELVTSA